MRKSRGNSSSLVYLISPLHVKLIKSRNTKVSIEKYIGYEQTLYYSDVCKASPKL